MSVSSDREAKNRSKATCVSQSMVEVMKMSMHLIEGRWRGRMSCDDGDDVETVDPRLSRILSLAHPVDALYLLSGPKVCSRRNG